MKPIYLAAALLCLWVAWLNNWDMGEPPLHSLAQRQIGVKDARTSSPTKPMTRKQALQMVYLYGQNNE